MKSKKITAWILFMAMLVTMLPSSLVFALTPDNNAANAYFPTIITSSFGDITNDADGVVEGTDLDINKDKDYEYSAELIPTQDVSAGIVDETNPDNDMGFAFWKNEDEVLKHYRRRQFLNFGAKSNAENVLERSFRDEDTETKITKSAVEIAYMDANKNPLVIKEGTKFEMTESTWDKAWIDLSTDIQRTNVNLNTFLKGVDSYGNSLMDLNTGVELDNTKLAVADLAATGDQISFMIYNVVDGEFSGYLRIKITDNSGKVTIQDYPFVADGQYPEINIETSTQKNNVGEDVVSEHKNTFIASADFEQVQESVDEENRKISKRYAVVDESALTAALNWEDENYMPEDIWAMNDVTVDTLKVSDSIISSEIESVTYTIQHYPDSVVLSSGKATYKSGEIENFADGNYNIVGTVDEKIVIPVNNEGLNILTIVATDKSGLVKTNRYYFFMDKEPPKAKFNLAELDENVVSLLTVADVVTNRQQAIDMSASDDVTASVEVISGLEDATAGETEKNKMYQYRLLATKEGAAEGEDVPDGYTSTVLDKEGNDLSGWKIWTGETETPVIDKEFDGIVQVRVQDRAGNWSPIVSTTSDGKETIITDNTNPVIDVKEYALNSNADTTGNTSDEIINGTATDILVTTARVTEKTDGEIENEVIHTTTGDVAPWINDSAVLEVKITDEDLVNEIRSSGLNKGQINVKAEFNAENENKKIKIWNKNGVDKKNVDDSFNLTEDYIFGTETDKDLTFYIEYEGTGVVDITVSVKDQADVNDGDVFSSIYKTQLRVDKINPYIIYKGYDITEKTEIELKDGTDMPWGPNSQVLEVVVNDNNTTDIQSGFLTDDNKSAGKIEVQSDKEVHIYKTFEDAQTHLDEDEKNDVDPLYTIAGNSKQVIKTTDLYTVADDNKEALNLSNTFYVVYEGTGIAKINFYAMDEAGNVRNYPEVDKYDAMLRVDKINPEIKNVTLVQTSDDVNDDISLFTINKTEDVEVNTRKKMKITFEIDDNNSANDVFDGANSEQSGVNVQDEYLDTDLIDVCGKYVVNDKAHLYKNVDVPTYATDGANDIAIDPHIDFILIPAEIGAVDSEVGGKFLVELPTKTDNDSIKKWVDDNIAAWEKEEISVDWEKAVWEDGGIVVLDEFQGAIVLRTIDRVGNIDYYEPITFVAESREAIIEFNPQTGFIYSQNNYGWSKRNNDYIEIRVKDNNETAIADAWIENVFIKVTDFEGNEMDAEFAYTLDGTTAANVSKYNYKALADSGKYHVDYGYDVIDGKGLIETTIRDKEGYIHLGYVKVSENAKIEVTIFDKAKENDVEYTGNKTTGTWITRFDRTAPIIGEFSLEKLDSDAYSLILQASDEESGMAPAITDSDYNNYKAENIPDNIFDTETSYLYSVKNDIDEEVVRFNSGIFNQGQYELPGLQYALLEEGDTIEDIEPWEFEKDPNGQIDKVDAFDDDGYHRGKFGKTLVWHNYKDAMTKVVDGDFDGYIVVRAIDRAGNITVMGYAPTLDVTADDAWKKETQYINVKALDINGDAISKVEYYGNNGLLYPESAKRDITAEALSGEGAFIEVVEEGITKVIVKASKSYADEKNITLGESGLRNDIWEGNLILGNPTATGYEDWKYQITDVKIDKTAPTFNFELKGDTATEKDKKLTETDVAVGPITINIVDANDPTPNKDVDTMSHIASGIKIIEWCAIPEGSEEEIWKNYEEDGGDVVATNFTGTIKIRVTDNAGNVTEKSRRINIDSVTPIISISNDSTGKCSHDPVTVFVTVSENAEFSDVKSVTYKATHTDEEGTEIVETGELPLIGGTITVDWEGATTVEVTATNKANVSKTEETTVLIHYSDVDIPKIKGTVANDTVQELKSGDWVVERELEIAYEKSTEYPVWYSLNGGNWTEINDVSVDKIGLKPGANTVRIQSRSANCLCESDVVTYIVNYDNVVAPKVDIKHDFATKEKDVDIFGESFKVVNVSNTTRMVSIVPNKGESVADIVAVKYDLLHSDGIATKKDMYSPIAGTTLALTDEGEWHIANIRVTTASGLEYVKVNDDTFVVNTEEIQSQYESYDLNGECPVYLETVAKIDKTAPEIDETELTPVLDSENKEIELFGLSSLTDKQKGLKVKATDDMITSEDKGRALLKYEYALLEKGTSVPNWKQVGVGYGWSGDSVESGEPIITTDFEGEVFVKVTDIAGNSTIKSISVVADANSPEISITAPYGWQKQDATVTIDVFDKGTSSEIDYVEYTLKKKIGGTWSEVGTMSGSTKKGEANPAKLTSRGGQISISNDGEYEIVVTAYDYAGNSGTQSVEVKVDRTAPTYSGSVSLSLYNVHNIAESNWNTIHDGWTYNHAVSLAGVTDATSGLKKVDVKFTNAKGETTSTTFGAHQTGAEFTASGKYDLTLTDNAGNVRNIGFTIDETLENVINVVGVDEVGKLQIAVTDGDDMLTFYKKENSESKYTKMYNGITDQLVDGKTGVRYIYGQNDSGKKSNTLYVIVAPSTEYGISLMSLNLAPNRYLNIDAEGGNVTVKKIDEIFNPGINKNISVGSVVEINEDGVYSITTND